MAGEVVKDYDSEGGMTNPSSEASVKDHRTYMCQGFIWQSVLCVAKPLGTFYQVIKKIEGIVKRRKKRRRKYLFKGSKNLLTEIKVPGWIARVLKDVLNVLNVLERAAFHSNPLKGYT